MRNPVHSSPHPEVYDNHIRYLVYTAVERELFYKCPKSVSPVVNSSFRVIFKSAGQARTLSTFLVIYYIVKAYPWNLVSDEAYPLICDITLVDSAELWFKAFTHANLLPTGSHRCEFCND